MRTAALLTFACSTFAFGQVNAGVSDERVALPEAPGSISGVGENAVTGGNQGQLSYSVAFEVPPGFPGVTPELSIGYSSSGGASAYGLGWSMPSFAIERMTVRGLQRYTADDSFVVDGATELVRVAESGTSATYRARFEGGFIRYTWLSRGTAGSWRAEYPDGRVAYYGADAAGTAVPTAQIQMTGPTRVFAWHLVLMEDQWGHQLKFTWSKDAGGTALLERIEYLFEGTVPRHSVRFVWEARPDVQSDAKPGFELLLTQRLKEVQIFSGTTAPEQVRKYVLDYESPAMAGGLSRLASVSRFGQGNVAYPVRFSFGYSKTLGGACTTDCSRPFVVNMGTLGAVGFGTGRATLVDINGDALPDVLNSTINGEHQFFYAQLSQEGRATFSMTPVASQKTAGNSPFVIGDAPVQLLDVNGDGFVDVTQARLGQVLCNNGSGDWVDAGVCTGSSSAVPSGYALNEDGDVLQQDPQFVRFFDYDNDKRIDWLSTASAGAVTQVLANTADAGYVGFTVDPVGSMFDVDPLELADLNGDGLQDPVELVGAGTSVTLRYKLNLGLGQWSPMWRQVVLSGFNSTQTAVAELQDVDGDGMADVVAVAGSTVAFALNRGGGTFAPVMNITSADLGAGQVPARGPMTTISYADMNGNGSDDIVWIQANGTIEYLELFPVRPNLISRIDNGVGAVQLITYGTSIAEQARDLAAGRPWNNRVPNPTVLITRIDSFVTLTGTDSGGLHEVVDYRYHSGFYDGVEKQFRGYEVVENEMTSGMSDARESSRVVLEFDVGKSIAALAGRQRKRSVYSLAGANPVLVTEERSLQELCPVAEVPPMTTPAIQFVCQRAQTDILVERDAANALTTEVQREFDGYGNVTRVSALGVKHLGTPESPRGCAPCTASGVFGKPCGDQCTGDENFSVTDFISPGTATGGAWLLGRASRQQQGAVATSLKVETRTFYDGPDFVGLPLGQLTKGGVTRTERRIGPNATDFVDKGRVRRDATGNVLVSIEPNGTLTGTSQRRLFSYDAAGFWATRVDVVLEGQRVLRRDQQYEASFEKPSQASNWYAVDNGQPAATPQLTRYRYDAHGRLARTLDPGDSETSPSAEFQYELADPSSRIVTTQRTAASGGDDLVTAICFDGRGRPVQTRQRISATSWQVSGFKEYDARGVAVRVFQAYLATTGACERSVPANTPFLRMKFDVLGRPLSELDVDGSTRRHEYAPLVHRAFDETDADPVVEENDGLGRLVSTERTGLGSNPVRLEYDADGRLFTVRDPGGTAHLQRYDALGRLTEVTDVNAGVARIEYDAADNVIRRVDGRGKAVRTEFDALNRPTAQWDEADQAGTRVQWTYDAVAGCADCTNAGGKLVQSEWVSGGAPAREREGYDVKGNTVFQEKLLDGKPLVVRYRYDGADRLTATEYPAGLTVERRWDGASRVSSLPGYVDSVAYDQRGLLETMNFTNGVRSSFGYDERLRPARVATTAAGGSVFDLALTRSADGLLTSVVDSGSRRARHGATFSYDAWSRVTSATLDREGAAEELSFTLDARDRILGQTSSLGASSPAQVGDYTYDAVRVNALTAAGGTTYSSDAAGFMTTRGDVSYGFDHLGRLTSASGGALDATFRFGPGALRQQKQEGDFTTRYESDTFQVRDGIAVVYVKFGPQRVARVQSDALAATLLSDLAPASGSGTLTPLGNQTIDIGDAWLAQAAAVGAVQLSGGPTPSGVTALLASAARRLLVRDVVWLHQDHQQNVVAATGGDGAVLGEQSFYPTGLIRSTTGFVDAYGFTGQEHDTATGLVHFQYRELDPLAGRWASVDPLFSQLTPGATRLAGQSTTAYAYVGNNFANEVDPTGLVFGRLVRFVSKISGRGSRARATAARLAQNARLYATRLNAPRPQPNQYANFEPVYSNFEPVYSNFEAVYSNFEAVNNVYANFAEPLYDSSEADVAGDVGNYADAANAAPEYPGGGIYGRAFVPPIVGEAGGSGAYGRAYIPGGNIYGRPVLPAAAPAPSAIYVQAPPLNQTANAR